MRPFVSVILTHQLDQNLPYLLLAVKSLSLTVGIHYEVWIMSGAETKPEIPELKLHTFRLVWDPSLNTSTLKIRKALDLVSKHSTHILLMSDDVIVNIDTLSHLYAGFNGRDMIINPSSNSDSRSLYEAHFTIGDLALVPDMSLEDFTEQQIQTLMLVQFPYLPVLMPCQCVSFYCTMIPKTTLEKVGFLDPHLEYRCNDQDFCIRAWQMGIPSRVNFAAFAFHFGSKTLRKMDPDHQLGDRALNYFKNKWQIK